MCTLPRGAEFANEKGFLKGLYFVGFHHPHDDSNHPPKGNLMAKFIRNLKSKVEHYKTKAEEIRAMVEEGAETIREIRADVESTVEDLKADSEEKMMESLEKIQDAERVFKEAGYRLHAVRMEMGFNSKVVSVLRRESAINKRKQERLLKQHADNKLLSSMLNSLFKAEALEDKVHLRRLIFHEVQIEVGMVPAVHVVWEDKNSAVAATATPSYTSPFTSSRSSFTSSSTSFPRSSFAEVAEEEADAEPLPIAEPAEADDAAVEETEEGKEFTAPQVSASARDPEDDKWTSFPDISFPGSK
jgi:hypothetical protein